jgi:hypothetical protein
MSHSLVMSPTHAHTVKTASDVAATFHLEPSHNPKAGEPAKIWFALTKAGGQQIPLSDCNCQLAVKQGETNIATVPLQAINAEQYQGIPGGETVFPKVGIYQLIFSGKAKEENAFQPFELKYEVTVQPGKAATTRNATEVPMSYETIEFKTEVIELPWLFPGLLIAGAIGAAAIGYWLVRRRDR